MCTKGSQRSLVLSVNRQTPLQPNQFAAMNPHNHKMPQRVVLYPKDVENITGRRGSTARRLIQKIREALGKSRDEFITIQEFSYFTGIDEELIKDFLQS